MFSTHTLKSNVLVIIRDFRRRRRRRKAKLNFIFEMIDGVDVEKDFCYCCRSVYVSKSLQPFFSNSFHNRLFLQLSMINDAKLTIAAKRVNRLFVHCSTKIKEEIVLFFKIVFDTSSSLLFLFAWKIINKCRIENERLTIVFNRIRSNVVEISNLTFDSNLIT